MEHRPTDERKRRRNATLSSNTALVVTCTIVSQDFPPQLTKGTDPDKKKKKTAWGVTISTNSLQKMSGHSKFNKMAVYAAVTCGMIRDHPGMLRLVGLYCARTDFCMGRKETERMDIMWGRRKMLCWATKQKVSDSLFPIQSGAQPGGSALVTSWFWGQLTV